MTTPNRRLHTPLGWLLAVASAGPLLSACHEDDQAQDQADSDGPETIEISEDIVDACAGYCENLAKCNDETVAEECEKKCEGVLYACEEHQPGEAIDQVVQCGEEDCLALPLCTGNAGIQCLTGLGF
jgi:hypothetical protein